MVANLRWVATLGYCILHTTLASAGPTEQATMIHNRLTGVPPSPQVLQEMTGLIADGKAEQAAYIAMENENFYRITVKTMVTKWTNVDEKNDQPLNDYSATVIGFVRDDLPFNTLLTTDQIYTAAAGTQVPAYSPANNNHYEQFESLGMSYKTQLAPTPQSQVTGIATAAGIYTTRAFGEAYYDAGTNRRPIQFTMRTFLCRDMESLHDTTRPDAEVRRDVDRNPGGDALQYINRCKGCHSGMDPLSRAFAYIDFEEGRLIYTPNSVREKMNRSPETFPSGFTVENDQWRLYWDEGQNENVGWNGNSEGTGLASFGDLVASTDAFPKCMTQHVFETLCLRKPGNSDQATIDAVASNFKSNGYKMKEVFAQVAVACAEEVDDD